MHTLLIFISYTDIDNTHLHGLYVWLVAFHCTVPVFLYGSLCLGSLAVEFFEINDCAVYFSYPNETFLITNTSVYETMRDNCGIVKG